MSIRVHLIATKHSYNYFLSCLLRRYWRSAHLKLLQINAFTVTDITARWTPSNCICQDAVAVHFWRLLHSAFAIVTNFLATAVMMTLCGFPALRRRSAKDLRLGL